MISVGAVAALLLAGCAKEDPKVHNDGTILTPYKAISERLADDTIDGLPELGAMVIEASESAQGDPGFEDIIKGAQKVGSPDIATARSAFKHLSDGMIDHMRAKGDKHEGHVIIHCTMAFNNAGALWVQNEGSIKNPYHGKMMLRCGDRLAWDADLPTTWAG